MKKICLIASSGGHFEQLLMLKSLLGKHQGFIVTEKTKYEAVTTEHPIYYLKQVNRHEKTFLISMLINFTRSFKIFLKEKPDVVISTGALATIPLCLIAKIFRKKIIFIESFAKITTPTLTGKFLYKFADKFYVQWESMREHYPNAVYEGAIY